MDLLDLWRDKITVRKVLNLVDRLPRHSQFRAEFVQDDEIAEQWASEHDGERPVPDVPVTEWTPEVERLTELVDVLAENTAILAAANTKDGRYRAPQRMPRPHTAYARVLARREDDAYQDLLADIEASKRGG